MTNVAAAESAASVSAASETAVSESGDMSVTPDTSINDGASSSQEPKVKKTKTESSPATVELVSHIGELTKIMTSRASQQTQPQPEIAQFTTMVTSQYNMLSPEQQIQFKLKVQRAFMECLEQTYQNPEPTYYTL